MADNPENAPFNDKGPEGDVAEVGCPTRKGEPKSGETGVEERRLAESIFVMPGTTECAPFDDKDLAEAAAETGSSAAESKPELGTAGFGERKLTESAFAIQNEPEEPAAVDERDEPGTVQ